MVVVVVVVVMTTHMVIIFKTKGVRCGNGHSPSHKFFLNIIFEEKL